MGYKKKPEEGLNESDINNITQNSELQKLEETKDNNLSLNLCPICLYDVCEKFEEYDE